MKTALKLPVSSASAVPKSVKPSQIRVTFPGLNPLPSTDRDWWEMTATLLVKSVLLPQNSVAADPPTRVMPLRHSTKGALAFQGAQLPLSVARNTIGSEVTGLSPGLTLCIRSGALSVILNCPWALVAVLLMIEVHRRVSGFR